MTSPFRRGPIAAVLLTAAVASVAAQASLSKYGVADAHAKEMALSAIEGMYSPGTVAKPFLALSPTARAAAVNDAVAWAKAYYASSVFAQAWASERQGAKPDPPAVKGSVDEETKEELASQVQQATEMRKMLTMLPADQRPQMETVIKQIEDRAKDPATIAQMKQTITARRADDQERYQADLKRWNEDRPADPKSLIAGHLHEFLTTSADVDFDAKVEARDGRKVFVDERYEQKSSFWKMCYRAGREANAAARAAATAWLKEIEK